MGKPDKEVKNFAEMMTELGLEKYGMNQALIQYVALGVDMFGNNSSHMNFYKLLAKPKLKCHCLLIWALCCDRENEIVLEALNKLKHTFTQADWLELIKATKNVTAKIEYAKNCCYEIQDKACKD